MNKQKQNQMVENSTKIISYIFSSLSSNITSSSSLSPPVRTRNVVNAIYIAGIVFMIGIFLLLLWVNLFSRHCRGWHDTSVSNRFNRQRLIRRSMTTSNDSSSSKTRHKRNPSNEDELEWTFFFIVIKFHINIVQMSVEFSHKQWTEYIIERILSNRILVFCCLFSNFFSFVNSFLFKIQRCKLYCCKYNLARKDDDFFF